MDLKAPQTAADAQTEVGALLSPAVEARAAAAAERARAVADAERLAAATPLPGALRDAFRHPDTVTVGPYAVRPVYDGDIELLHAWGHPFAEWLIAHLAGRESAEFVPRGPDAWVLFWLFTQPVAIAEALMAAPDGRERAYREAATQFRRITLAQGLALFEAVVRQLGVLIAVGQQVAPASATANKPVEERRDP